VDAFILEFCKWVIGLIPVVIVTLCIVRFIRMSDSADDLKRRLEKDDVPGVKSVLLVHGHMLRPNVKRDAELWVASKEGMFK
jgi:hypothetical protein